MNARGGWWQGFGHRILGRIRERLGKTIHNGPLSTLPQPCYGTRQVVEANLCAFLPCLGGSVALSVFRAGRREEFVGMSSRL